MKIALALLAATQITMAKVWSLSDVRKAELAQLHSREVFQINEAVVQANLEQMIRSPTQLEESDVVYNGSFNLDKYTILLMLIFICQLVFAWFAYMWVG